MQVYLGADHGGFALKEQLKTWLTAQGYSFTDLGALELDEADDYPRPALAVAERVAAEPDTKGVLVCRSGGGMVIAANKVKGIRAVAVNSPAEVKHAVIYNNANIISLAGDRLSTEQAETIIKTYLETEFIAEQRHVRRLKQIANYEAGL